MNYPDDVMETFLTLSRALGVSTDRGVIEATVPDPSAPDGFTEHEIPDEHVDELFARGWLVAVGDQGDEVEASESGIYHLNRWLAKQKTHKARRSVKWQRRQLTRSRRRG